MYFIKSSLFKWFLLTHNSVLFLEYVICSLLTSGTSIVHPYFCHRYCTFLTTFFKSNMLLLPPHFGNHFHSKSAQPRSLFQKSTVYQISTSYYPWKQNTRLNYRNSLHLIDGKLFKFIPFTQPNSKGESLYLT